MINTATRYIIVLTLTLVVSCKEIYVSELFFIDNELSITAYLERHDDDYSMMLELLEKSGFKSAFNAFGSYTLFIFNNDSFKTYLEQNGHERVEDLTVEEARLLIRFHAFRSLIHSSNMGLGRLPVRNMTDDQLVSNFDESGLQGIIINHEARVIRRDIELSNGMIHILDRPLTPLVKSVIGVLEAGGLHNIFVEATKVTGIYAFLDRIYDTLPSGEPDRLMFTLLAETDSIFATEGIFSLQDLKNRLNNGVNDPTNPLDSLNMFIANHVIIDRSLFTKDMETGNYQSLYGELISFEVDRDFRINPRGVGDQYRYISFLPGQIDIPAKNGVIHNIDAILDIFYPDPVEVIWEFNDQPVIRDMWRVESQNSLTYTTFDQFPNMWGSAPSGFFAHFPYASYGMVNERSLNFNPPSWDVSFRMPMNIVQGRYRLYVQFKDGAGRATIQILVNGVPIGEPVNMVGGRWYVVERFVGEVLLPDTRANEIRLVTVVNGMGQMDYLRFEPI